MASKKKLRRRRRRFLLEEKKKQDFLSLCELLTTYRRGVAAVRENTWSSMPEIGEGSNEALGSIVIGKKGKGTRGAAVGNRSNSSSHPGDYINGMECKSSDRSFPNIQFRLRGTPVNGVHVRGVGRRQLIRVHLDELPELILLQISRDTARMHEAIQGDYCSIQALTQRDGGFYALPILGRTQAGCLVQANDEGVEKWNGGTKEYQTSTWDEYLSDDYLALHGSLETGTYIRMSEQIDMPENKPFDFILRMEDSHTNWTAKNRGRDMLDWFNSGGIVFVQHYLDRMARVCVAVLLLNPTKSEMNVKIHKDWQYGWKEHPTLLRSGVVNTRMWKNGSRVLQEDNWSYLKIGAELIALAAETPEGFELLHWAPKGGRKHRLSNRGIKEKLLSIPDEVKCCPVEQSAGWIDWNDSSERHKMAEQFFRDCIVPFYRSMNQICDNTGTARNTGFGSLGEHLCLLWYGLRGCRVDKGGDAYEVDNSVSEIKTATGMIGDCMGSLDVTNRYNLYKHNISEIQQFRRIFFNRVVDMKENIDGKERCNLRIALLAPTVETMSDRCSQLYDYFSGEYSSSQMLQYKSRPIDQDYAQLDADSQLHFTRVAEFIEHNGEDYTAHTNEIPEVPPCQCNHCSEGIMRWEPPFTEGSRADWCDERTLVIDPHQ